MCCLIFIIETTSCSAILLTNSRYKILVALRNKSNKKKEYCSNTGMIYAGEYKENKQKNLVINMKYS